MNKNTYLFSFCLFKFKNVTFVFVLKASLDEPTQTVIMHRTEPTKLQTLALQLSEKITTLMDQTERTIQIKGGEMGGFFQRNGK